MKISAIQPYHFYEIEKRNASIAHGRATLDNLLDLSKKMDEHSSKLDAFSEILKTRLKKE